MQGAARVVEASDPAALFLAAEAGDKLRITRTATGLARALAFLKIEIRYNVRGARHEWREVGEGWEEGTDHHDDSIRERIAERCVCKAGRTDTAPALFGAETWTRCRNALLRNLPADPFEDYLAGLPEHDGEARLCGWLHEVFETDESLLSRWASAFVFQGAVERTLEPGCKLDEMPVLIGPEQGIGKSTALSAIFPPAAGAEWFNDSLQLAAPDTERAEALLGRVLVEAGEMAGSSRAELQSLKAFLSRTHERLRLKYRRNPETIPRRCIIVGTTNEENCLPNDPSGNRRFVAVHVQARKGGAGKVRAYLDMHREQLWAEALAGYRGGIRARLPDGYKAAQTEANEGNRRRDDILEDAVERFIDEIGDHPFKLAYAAVRCGLIGRDNAAQLGMRESKRLAAAFTVRGFTGKQKRRNGGKPETLWAQW